MSSYRHLPLPSEGDYIRLLCLLPNESEAEPLRCRLHNYSLQKSSPRTHRYEALSYAWGDPHEKRPVYVDGDQFLVTINLYAARLHLRDHSFERIMWIDAICINQTNPVEQGQQVSLMAKIYSSAHRVIVWLGEKAKDTDRALENIYFAANGKSTEHLKKETILNLLQRPWFQRIWVLQEIAAARHVVIMCGSTEIDGYAFCLGVHSLKLPYTASPEFQTLPSVTYLIERAGLRSKYITNLSERFSLNIRCLAELIDMFHTRKATDLRDKVYALHGMSSDAPEKLRPDYEVPWEELFKALIKFVLGNDISVENWGNTEKALIKGKGCILGQVSSIKSDNRQNVNITFTSKNTAWCLGDEIEWALQASAKPIQKSDIVCLLQGTSKPTIVRLCKDHFAIVVIAVTPLKESGSFKKLELSKSTISFPRDFLLIWDWKQLPEESQDREMSKNWVFLDWASYKATRIWNVALILGDLGEYSNAEKRLREAIENYKIVFGEEQSMLKCQYVLTPLSWAAGIGNDAIVNLLLAKDSIDPDLKDSQYGQTPLAWAAQYGHEVVVKLLLETGQVNIDSKGEYGQTPFSWTVANGHEAVVKLLLATGQVDIDLKDKYGQTPLSRAAVNGHEAVVKLLLETGQVDIDSKDKDGQTPLSLAAENGHEAVVKLLLETGQVDIDSKDEYGQTPLSWAAENGHETVIKLLLETGQVNIDSKDEYGQTPLSWAAKNGHETVVKLLLATGQVNVHLEDRYGRTPLSRATEYRHEAVAKLLREYIS